MPAKPTGARRSMPTWLLVLGCGVFGAGAAVVAAALVIALLVAFVPLPSDDQKKIDGLAQRKPVDEDKAKEQPLPIEEPSKVETPLPKTPEKEPAEKEPPVKVEKPAPKDEGF